MNSLEGVLTFKSNKAYKKLNAQMKMPISAVRTRTVTFKTNEIVLLCTARRKFWQARLSPRIRVADLHLQLYHTSMPANYMECMPKESLFCHLTTNIIACFLDTTGIYWTEVQWSDETKIEHVGDKHSRGFLHSKPPLLHTVKDMWCGTLSSKDPRNLLGYIAIWPPWRTRRF